MNSRFMSALATVSLVIVASCSDSSQSKAPAPSAAETTPLSDTERRLADLSAVKAALEKYHSDKQAYPVSKGFDGLHSQWGEDTATWIADLSPTYITELPLDPGKDLKTPSQYIYRSDGIDYKLLAHGIPDCEEVRKTHATLIDSKRDCWAYGYWTTGAIEW